MHTKILSAAAIISTMLLAANAAHADISPISSGTRPPATAPTGPVSRPLPDQPASSSTSPAGNPRPDNPQGINRPQQGSALPTLNLFPNNAAARPMNVRPRPIIRPQTIRPVNMVGR